eukprot:Skav218035  [mRNA]  locus=scaffold214:554591:559293:+ [translate_table: standard]
MHGASGIAPAPCHSVQGLQFPSINCGQHAEITERERFWAALSQARKGYESWPLLGGLDANSRLGSVQDVHVGPAGAVAENQNAFHQWLREQHLLAPTIMERAAWRRPIKHVTWKSCNDWVRLEYLVLPLEWAEAQLTCATNELGLEPTHEDHLSVTCRLQIHVECLTKTKVVHTPQPFDRNAMMLHEGSAVCKSFLRACLETPALQGWNLAPDTFALRLDQACRSGLAKQFPLQKRKKHQTRITECTWTWLAWSRRNRHAAFNAQLRSGALWSTAPTRDQWQPVVQHHHLPQRTHSTKLARPCNCGCTMRVASNETLPAMPSLAHLPARDAHQLCEQVRRTQDFEGEEWTAAKRAHDNAQLTSILGRGSAIPEAPSESESTNRTVPFQSPVLPTMDGSFFVLYVYAGHVRDGDMVQCMQELGQVYDMHIQVLPLDIVLHSELCDLINPRSQTFWKQLVASHCFLGLIGAPPCETWSVARWGSLLHKDSGPRPVRTLRQPWALQSSSVRELKQVSLSNDLLQYWFLMIAIATRLQISWLTEHPGWAKHVEQAASIWALPQAAALRTAGACEALLLQGHYGAPCAKPTTFLHFGLRALDESLQTWRDPSTKPAEWTLLKGKADNGGFKTMMAKACPRRLNFAICEAYVQRAIALSAQGSQHFDCDFAHFRSAVAAIQQARRVSGHTMGRDYAPAVEP